MMWGWKKFRKETQARQETAERAILQAEVDYLDAVNLQMHAERITQGLEKMRRENNFGYKFFGVVQ